MELGYLFLLVPAKPCAEVVADLGALKPEFLPLPAGLPLLDVPTGAGADVEGPGAECDALFAVAAGTDMVGLALLPVVAWP